MSEKLFDNVFVPACSPTLGITRHDDLHRHTLLHYQPPSHSGALLSWTTWQKLARVPDLDMGAGLVFSDETHTITAALDGQGIALMSKALIADELASGRLDLAADVLLPLPDAIEHRPVMSGPLVVIMRPGHPLAGKLDLPAYLAAQHVLVSSRREGPGMEDFGLSRLGYRRNIRLRCQHHMAALSTVMGSDLLLTLPGLLARQLAPAGLHAYPIRLIAYPQGARATSSLVT